MSHCKRSSAVSSELLLGKVIPFLSHMQIFSGKKKSHKRGLRYKDLWGRLTQSLQRQWENKSLWMDPRNQTVKGQGEVGHLPFPTQAAWICAAKQCSLKYPNPESSLGWAVQNEAQEGTEGTQGSQRSGEPLWNDQKTLVTGQLKHLSQGRAELQLIFLQV